VGYPMWSRRLLRTSCSAALLLAAASGPGQAVAQGRDSDPLEQKGSYSPTDFARFAPRTALAMLRHVPGLLLDLDESRIGSAPGLIILLNGRALSRESEDVLAQLDRVSAADVIRIELQKDDWLGPVNMTETVVNIVTRRVRVAAQFSLRPELDFGYGRPLLLTGDLSISTAIGRLAYTLDVRNDGVRRAMDGLKLVYAPDGDLLDYRNEIHGIRETKLGLTGSVKYEGPDAVIGNFKAAAQIARAETREISDRKGTNLVDRTRFSVDRNGTSHLQADLDYGWSTLGGELKLITLFRSDHNSAHSQTTTYFADASAPVGGRFVRHSAQTEAVGRVEFGWKESGTQWQLSAETAFNELEVDGKLLDLARDQTLIPAALDRVSGGLEERRAAAAISLVRPLGERMILHGIAGAKVSTLAVGYPLRSTRSFFHPEGSISIGWTISPRWTANAGLARSVGNLRFLDFFSSKHLRSGDVTSGNPRLVAPSSWELEIEARRELGPIGSGTLRFYARRIDDVIDYVQIDAGAEAVGNLSHASLIGAEARSVFNLDSVGWTGAKAEAEIHVQQSRVRDPMVGTFRRVSGDLIDSLRFSLRHDIKGTEWGWGAAYLQQRRAPTARLLTLTRSWDTPGETELFVENTDVMGLTMRLTALNLAGLRQHTDRRFFLGSRASALVRSEASFRERSPSLALSISGKF
jgi:outer membrane receptor for ferrienterochelin and colicins